MEWLRDWLQQLLVLLVFAAFFDLIVTEHSTQKYIKLVISFCILLSLISPLIEWLEVDSAKQIEQKFTEYWQGLTSDSEETNQPVIATTVHDQQTQTIVEQQMATQVMIYLRTHHEINTQCEVKLADSINDMQNIERLRCTKVTRDPNHSRQATNSESSIATIQSMAPVLIFDTQDQEHQEPVTIQESQMIQTLREYIRKEWAMEVNGIEFK